jgi:anti-sigma B factor antagonist/stage II sporulation protein AA (anti-sigma F factor antagonist)
MGAPENLSNLREDHIGEVFILRLRGRLDAVSSPQVEHKIFEAINSGQTKMLIEMGGVIYLSSAGLRMLFSTTKKLRSLSGKLVVCNMATNVSDVLKMSGFDHVLDLAKNEEEALKHF